MKILSPSILAADFSCLGDQIRAIDKAGAQYFHIDVMDGHFVESISFGVPVIASNRKVTERVFDVHLMVEEPGRTVELVAKAGADIITVHEEACKDLEAMVDKIRGLNCKVGVAINPDTGIDRILSILPKVDMLLVMTVFPGYGGQALIPECIGKVRQLRDYIEKNGLSVDIQVDGGVNASNVSELLEAGANVIVAGSAVFKGDIEENVKTFLSLFED